MDLNAAGCIHVFLTLKGTVRICALTLITMALQPKTA